MSLRFYPEPIRTPENALYESEEQEGIAKFAATAYDANDGRLGESTPPVGRSSIKKRVLLVVSWSEDDVHGKATDPGTQKSRGTSIQP